MKPRRAWEQRVDLSPTILDAAGSPARAGVPRHGESLLGPVRRTDVFAGYECPVRTLVEIESPAMGAAAR